MSQPAWRRYERFHREDVDADLDDEFSAHLALLVDQHVAAGLPADAAEAEARRAFANAGVAMAECRKLTVARIAEQKRRADKAKLEADIRHLIREAAARPGAAATLIGGIAVVVAASTLLMVLLLQLSA